MLFLQNNPTSQKAVHVQVGAMYTPSRVSLVEYQYTQRLLTQLFQDTRTQTFVPAALSSSTGTQRDERLWSQTLSQGSPQGTLLVVGGPFLFSNPNFGIVKFINYVCMQIWFVNLKAESCVYYCIFKFMSCLYYLRSSSRETIGVVSIGMWVEKVSPN